MTPGRAAALLLFIRLLGRCLLSPCSRRIGGTTVSKTEKRRAKHCLRVG